MLRFKDYILGAIIGLIAFGFFYDRTYSPEDIKSIRISAENGDANAQVEYAEMYFSGKPLDQDYNKARFWFEHAANQDHSEAQYKLGFIYEGGLGVAVDMEQARNWYLHACNNHKRINDACEKLSNIK